jgi:hypothetical protein
VSALGTSSDADGLDDDLDALENELRNDGALSFATCEVLRVDRRFDGLESCLRFLRCTVFAADPHRPAVPRKRRIKACRLMLLSLHAHTPSPRCTPQQIEQLVEAALQIPGADLADLVAAQFTLLGETAQAPTHAQRVFIGDLGAQVAGKQRLGHSTDDFIWIAVRMLDPVAPHTQAQAYFAAQTLPDALRKELS